MVHVLPYIEDLRALTWLGPEDAVVGGAHKKSRWLQAQLKHLTELRRILCAQYQGLTDHVSRVVRSVKDGLRDAVNAVFHHALALQVHNAKGQSTGMVFSGLNFVASVLDEKIGPRIEVAVVERLSVSGIGVIDLKLQIHQSRFGHNGLDLLEAKARGRCW